MSVTKLISDIFEEQGEGVVMMIIWYLWKTLNVLCTGHPDCVACVVSEKFTQI